ncbi:hypothetical protein YC2023_017654 [Brassica napus]
MAKEEDEDQMKSGWLGKGGERNSLRRLIEPDYQELSNSNIPKAEENSVEVK